MNRRVTLNGKSGLVNLEKREVCQIPDNCNTVTTNQGDILAAVDRASGATIQFVWRPLDPKDRIMFQSESDLIPR